MAFQKQIPKRDHKILHIPLGKMRVSPLAQRILKPAWASYLAANLNFDKFGIPVLNLRSFFYYIMDGQHRILALREWLGEGWEVQEIECMVFEGYTEQQEAEEFLELNKKLGLNPYEKFKVSITAKRYIETEVKKTVEQQGLVISSTRSTPGSIAAVGTLTRIYIRSDGFVLGRALRLIRDSFGDSGFEAKLIDGMSLVCQRYNGAIDEQLTVKKLSARRGGMTGLTNRAFVLRKATGYSMAHCIAAATVETINSGRGGVKLSPWWKTEVLK